MTETIAETMTTPNGWDDAPPARRNGSRGMVPGTWLAREVRLEYVDAAGKPVTTSGVLLDWCPFGPIFNLSGERAIVAWDRICLVTLASD